MTQHRKWILFLLLPLLFFSYAFKGYETNIDSLEPLVEYLIDVAKHHRQDRSQPVPMVAIGGCPGAGKTSLAKLLLSTLQNRGIYCIVLPLDHFVLSANERKKLGTEWDIHHFKSLELHACLSSIFNGKKLIEKPTYNQFTCEVGSEMVDLHEVDLILFEGLYATCSNAPLNFFDYCCEGIFLDADEADISKWRWERELKKTHPKTKEHFTKVMEILLKDFHENIAYSKKNTLFLITKDHDHTYHLEIQNFIHQATQGG